MSLEESLGDAAGEDEVAHGGRSRRLAEDCHLNEESTLYGSLGRSITLMQSNLIGISAKVVYVVPDPAERLYLVHQPLVPR